MSCCTEWSKKTALRLAVEESISYRRRHQQHHGELRSSCSSWRRRHVVRSGGRRVADVPRQLRRLFGVESTASGCRHHSGRAQLRQLPSSVILHRHVTDEARRSAWYASTDCRRGSRWNDARCTGSRCRTHSPAVYRRLCSEPGRYDAPTTARWLPRYL